MSIRDNIAAWRRERVLKAAIAEGLIVPSRESLPRHRGVTRLRGDYTMRNSELIFAAVSRIANSLSAMPISLYKGDKKWQNEVSNLVSLSPNPSMTSCVFFRTLEACRCTYGNGYALKVYDVDGTLSRLDVLDPSRVRPIIDKDTMELWYRVQPEEGESYYIHNFYMIHVPFISTNGFVGVNPVSVLLDTLSYSDNIRQFQRDQLEQGVNAAIVLEAPANLGDTQKQNMIASFIKTYKETSGNILLLESGVTAKTLNLSPVDTKLLEVEKITRSKVAMVYNIPPHLMGDYDGTSFSSQEQEVLEFNSLTMLPIVTMYEQEFNRKLVTEKARRQGYHWDFDMDAALRADAATQAEVDYKAVRSGWRTVDEIRATRNLPPLPGGIGKHALVSQDLATLDYTVKEKPKVMAAGKVNPVVSPEKQEGSANG